MQVTLDTVNGKTATGVPQGVASISTTLRVAGNGEFAVAVAQGQINGNNRGGQSPGAGWSSILTSSLFWSNVPFGPLTVLQAVNGGSNSDSAAQLVAVFGSNGSNPVFRTLASGTGNVGNNLSVALNPVPVAGRSLLLVNIVITTHTPVTTYTPSDTQSDAWVNIGQKNVVVTDGGLTEAIEIFFAYAENIVGGATTVNVAASQNNWGTWAVFEIANVGPVVPVNLRLLASCGVGI